MPHGASPQPAGGSTVKWSIRQCGLHDYETEECAYVPKSVTTILGAVASNRRIRCCTPYVSGRRQKAITPFLD
jgi:hypothetical protein